ncbi:MAG: crossover junction endodeoxyribonuclease RuvC [Candidatus Omnitrophica bacterium]|nr:crossover junction endodeoxyribonuclease RuvC [Candidatus Omnitrophota bacterium]
MKIIGIDPGTNVTGYGVVDIQKEGVILLETGSINPRAKDPLEARIHKVYKVLDEILCQYNPEKLILEKLYAHYDYPMTVGILGHVRGVICLLCAQKNIVLVEESPKRVRKALTGNGNASKLQTRRMVAHYLNLDEKKLTLDASDALALALGYAQLQGRAI